MKILSIKNSKVYVVLMLIVSLIIFGLYLDIVSAKYEEGDDRCGDGNCDPRERITCPDDCPPREPLSVSVNINPVSTADRDVYIEANASDPLNTVKTIKIYVDNNEKKSCEAKSCRYDFWGSDFSVAEHNYRAEALNILGTVEATSPTKTFRVIADTTQYILVSRDMLLPKKSDTIKLETSYSRTPPANSQSVKIYINDQEKQTCPASQSNCRYTFSGRDYPLGQQHTYYAELLDTNGNVLSRSATSRFTITDDTTSCNNNGRVDAGEQCDDGSNNGVCPKVCSNSCTWNNCNGCRPITSGVMRTCYGNEIFQHFENCDGRRIFDCGSAGCDPSTTLNGNTYATCRITGPILCPYPGTYIPSFPVPDPPNTVKEKVGRVMMCYPPRDESSMGNVVSDVNRIFNLSISRATSSSGGVSRDKINAPGVGKVDIVAAANTANPRWQWLIVEEGDRETGICPFDPILLEGFSQTKFNNPAKQSPKYKAARVFACFRPPEINSEVLSRLSADGLDPTQIRFDIINFNVEYEPGKKVGRVDVIRQPRPDKPYEAWQWLPVIEGGVTPPEGIRKCTPDEDVCGHCQQQTQCLVSIFPNNGISECIDSGQYAEDNLCENGQWSSRTKLLALKLLRMRSGDYTLFCDNRENTLNNLQYLSAPNEVVANVLTNLQTNNFCVLKTGNAVIVATSTNRNFEEVPNSLNIFGVTRCSVADDGKYYACDNSNKVWYNKKLKSLIYSASPISVPSDTKSFTDFIRNPIRVIIDAIKRLIAPSDQASLNAIKRFNRLYMTQQGSRLVIGSIEGRNPVNAVIEYNNFETNICNFIDQYNRTRAQDLSLISCRREGNKYYVLAQGSQLTNINPDSIWADLTSKLRLR